MKINHVYLTIETDLGEVRVEVPQKQGIASIDIGLWNIIEQELMKLIEASNTRS